ncbi:hypothetical protein M9435_006759 [Picochlorum sp. BPE23]|nr:hypothetical protein M9435_006759 [Picochlorum sp. BPE23]
MHVRKQLQDPALQSCTHQQDILAKFLAAGLFFLASALDGLVILDSKTPEKSMNFSKSDLQNPIALLLQKEIRALRSASSQNKTTYADFWTLWNFVKHYNAHCWMPRIFTVKSPRMDGSTVSIVDFFLPLDNGDESGPLFHDLVVPCFNKAVRICHVYAKSLDLTAEHLQIPEEIP